MQENDDLPHDSVDSVADGIENDDHSNDEQQELDPDHVRFFYVTFFLSLLCFLRIVR